MKPNKIVRADKILGAGSSLPLNQKYTFGEANEDRDKKNEIIDYLQFYVTSDISGIIDSSDLIGKDIGMIIGGGAILEEGIDGDGVNHFSKDTADSIITMINGNTLIPNKKYLILPR
jgi:hypothetical protein